MGMHLGDEDCAESADETRMPEASRHRNAREKSYDVLCVICRRGRFSLLAPGARLKGDRAGDNGESAPDVDPELAALMRDIAAGAGSPLAAADDAALTGRLL